MRPRTLLIALVAVVLVAAAGIVVVLQPSTTPARLAGPVPRIVLICPENDANGCGD